METNNIRTMANNEFTPFGEEWKKEMMQQRKEDLIEFYASIAKENLELKSEINTLKRQ